MLMTLTDGEIDWLICMCTSDDYTQDFRSKLFANRLRMRRTVPPEYITIVDIDTDTLWCIEGDICMNEPFSNHLFDQSPLKILADKIWKALAISGGYLDDDEDDTDTYEAAIARTSTKREGD